MSNPLILFDWKKWGSFIGLEYRMQLSAYAKCPYAYDKATNQVRKKEVADYAMVAWVGEKGFKIKLVMSKDELDKAYESFKGALKLYEYKKEVESQWMEKGRSYKNPMEPKSELVSVTEVFKHAVGKAGLMNWHYEMGAEGALRMVEAGKAGDIGAVLAVRDEINAKRKVEKDNAWVSFKEGIHENGWSPYARRDKAGDMGSTIHKNILFLLLGKEVDTTEAPAWLSGALSSFMMWLQKHVIEVDMVEQMVFNPEEGYAGTLDAQLLCKPSVMNGITEGK